MENGEGVTDMDLFALAARLTLDQGEYEAGLTAAEANLDGFAARLEQGLSMAERLTRETEETALHSAERFGDMIGGVFGRVSQEASGWGGDLVQNLINGMNGKSSELTRAVSGLAERIRSYLHFSEPDEGPLADFHTYAPDMMALFARGIRDNAHLVTEQVGQSFDLEPVMVQSAAATAGGQEIVVPRSGDRPVNIVFELDGAQQWIYRLNRAEEQRVGLKLSKGAMA